MTDVAATSDESLLIAYQRSGSAEVFRRIVDRYVDLVHSTALRQLRAEPHLAEDVTQAVFLILSQRAHRLCSETVLAGWFLLTTRNVARNALRREWRLKRRERKAAQMRDETIPPEDSRDILPILDDALARLSEPDRSAILLRFFHGKSHREVGAAMGMSEQAATKRVSRAIEKLRGMLEGPGNPVAESALTAALPLLAAQSAPKALVTAIHAGATTPAAAALTGSGTSAVANWAIATVAALVVGGGAYVAVTQIKAPKPGQSAAAAPAAKPVPFAAPAATAPAAPAVDSRTITIVAIDSQTKQPIAGASVLVQAGRAPNRAGKTDAQGQYSIGVPTTASNQDLRVRVSAPGRVPMSMWWTGSRLRGEGPSLVSVPLETGTTIGGVVCDPAGNPLAGARVRVHTERPNGFESPWPDLGEKEILTDATGRWQIDNAPSDLSQVWVMASHPDFPGSETESMPMVKGELLKKQTLVSTVRAIATQVSGVVLDPDGKPLAGASVTIANDRYDQNKATTSTDKNGQFKVAGFPKYYKALVVRFAGYAPQLVPILDPEHSVVPFEIKLARPVTLEGVVVGPDDKPIARANVDLESWRGSRAMEWKATTDAGGHFIWKEAPSDELQINVYAKGRGSISGQKVTAGKEPLKLVMYPPVTVSGAVIDAETKQPIPLFKMKHGIRWTDQEDVTWQSMDDRTLTNGHYDAVLDNISNGGKLMVEADGYEPLISRMIEAREGKITLDFELRKTKAP